MGLLDALRGKTKQVAPNLDNLFALPSAAITLESALDLVSSGQAGLCFKASSGASAASSEKEIRDLLAFDEADTTVQLSTDDLGFNWLVISGDDLGTLVTRIHGADSTLVENGFGPRLLCAVFGFTAKVPPGDGDVRLVYLMKQGTFYPFAPRDAQRRDNELELRVQSFLGTDLPMEKDLTRWMALWGLPVN